MPELDAEWVHVDQTGYPAVRGRGHRLSVDAGNPIPGLDLAEVALYAPTEAGLDGRTPEDALAAGAGLVVVTRGAAGCLAVTRDGERIEVPAPRVDAVSTLGAGDVFHGALLAQLVREVPLRRGARGGEPDRGRVLPRPRRPLGHPRRMSRDWWRSAVLYQVYVRSFCDADGDGVGDLAGIRSKLGHLHELGVDGIWLTPFYPSPGADHGYDVSDYCDVDPRFGTLEDFDALLADAHALGLRVIVDVVPNHCSIEHPWWREHPDWFVWRDEPNNWRSAFGGPAWSFDERRGQWYLHLFAPEQPDLDWHNPAVRDAFEDVLRFWLDRGVDGFRVDVAHGLFKDPSFADEPTFDEVLQFADARTAINQPELHPLYRRWRALVGDRILVGELVLHDQARVAEYLRPDELQLAFNFTLLKEEWDAGRMRATIDRTLDALGPVGAAATWVLENHDVTRSPTRFGGGAAGLRRARAAALLLLALPGHRVRLPGPGARPRGGRPPRRRCARTPSSSAPAARARAATAAACRSPGRTSPGFGFTSGTPWLPIPEGWGAVAADAQRRDAGSTLALWRAALALRRATPALREGGFRWLEAPDGVLAFERGEVRCLVNVSAEPLELPPGELLLRSDGETRPARGRRGRLGRQRLDAYWTSLAGPFQAKPGRAGVRGACWLHV